MNLFRPTKFSLWGSTDYTLPRVFFGGGKNQQSSSQVSIPPEVLANYQNVNSIANQVAQTPFTQYSQDPNAFVAPLTATQQAGVLGTNQYSNEAQPFYQQASNQNQTSTAAGQAGLNVAQGQTQTAGQNVTQGQISNYMNPYESAVINPTAQLMQQQFNQAQSGQLGNAINNGAFGGDRAAVTAANLQQQQGLAYGQTMGGLLNQNYSQALGAAQQQQGVSLQAANQYGQQAQAAAQLGQQGAVNQANFGSGAQAAGLSGAQAQLTAGQAQQQTEQAGLTALYNQFLQQQSYPFQTTQFLSNIAEGTGALSGSTTTSNQPAPYFSDERLKEDIKPIGETFDGLNIIKFRYKGDKQPQIGLSAQDVEKKHPQAVGLHGGYKTVDYDAATKSSEGGLVAPFRRVDGSIVPERRHFEGGGSAGFNLDPSYLQAQEAAYGNAPWGNAGPVSTANPYGGKSHVPPSTGGGHANLAVAKAPAPSKEAGLKGLSDGINQIEGLGKEGKSLYDSAKKVMPGLGGMAAPPQQAGPQGIGTGQPGAPAPSPNQPVQANPAPPPVSNDAASGLLADNSGLGVGTPDFSGLDDLDFLDAKRGGRIHREGGGATYQDASDDDQSVGGDIPYESGTGAQGLGIPDDKPHNQLASASPQKSNDEGGGLGDILGSVGKVAGMVLPFFAAKRGGRVGLAGGGSPDDMPLPAMDDASSIQQGLVAPDQAAALTRHAEPEIVLPAFDVKDKPVKAGNGRKSITGLNPDAPSPDAQPVQGLRPEQNQQQQDMGSGQHVTQPGEVLTQDNPGGIGDWLNKNQGLLVPALHGLGTMASSNSRYLGSAILQGLGGAADSYERTQNEMQTRAGNQPIIQGRQVDATNSALTGLAQFNQMNGTNLSLQDYLMYLKTGKVPPQHGQNGGSGGQGMTGGGPNSMGTPQNPTYSQYEKDHLVVNGVPAYNDPGYMSGYTNKWGGIAATSPYFHGQVEQGNHTVASNNMNGFTTDAQGNRVPVKGYDTTALAQNHPAVAAAQAQKFQDLGTEYTKEYQRSMSLFDELGDVYHQFQAGPTADWRASVSRLANEFDPAGNYPFLHSIPAGNDAANYDKARKDIAQLTASQLQSMPGGAPAHSTDLLGHYSADPHLSPDALRDIVIRGKSALQQQADYYQGFDPFSNGAKGVMAYTNDFYKTHPYDQYRKQFDKTTPAFAGQQQPTNVNNPGGGKGVQVAPIPSAAIDRLRKNPGTEAQFDQIFGAGAARRALGQ